MLDNPIYSTFFSLIVIVAFLVVILLFFKKYAVKAKIKKSGENGIEILSKIALQPKTFLYTIKVKDKILLIGTNEHSIAILADISENNQRRVIKKRPQSNTATNQKLPQYVSKEILEKAKVSDDSLSFKSFLNATLRRS